MLIPRFIRPSGVYLSSRSTKHVKLTTFCPKVSSSSVHDIRNSPVELIENVNRRSLPLGWTSLGCYTCVIFYPLAQQCRGTYCRMPAIPQILGPSLLTLISGVTSALRLAAPSALLMHTQEWNTVMNAVSPHSPSLFVCIS